MMNMPKSNSFANPFTAWSGHRMFYVVAGTLVGVMAVTQASAMLPTPEPELDNPSSYEMAAIANSPVSNVATGNYNNINLANAAMPAYGAANAQGAANSQGIVSKISAFLVTQDGNGQEVLVPVDNNTQLQSGYVLEYQGLFTNTNSDRVRKMTVTMSIPKEVALIGDIAPEFPFGSVDGVNFSRMPLRGTVNGQFQEIPLAYYQGIRWDIESVGLNDTVMVKYRATVK